MGIKIKFKKKTNKPYLIIAPDNEHMKKKELYLFCLIYQNWNIETLYFHLLDEMALSPAHIWGIKLRGLFEDSIAESHCTLPI